VDLLDTLARKRGITSVAELARYLDMSKSHLFRMRKGEVTAHVPMALRMARRMHTTVEKLFSGVRP